MNIMRSIIFLSFFGLVLYWRKQLVQMAWRRGAPNVGLIQALPEAIFRRLRPGRRGSGLKPGGQLLTLA